MKQMELNFQVFNTFLIGATLKIFPIEIINKKPIVKK